MFITHEMRYSLILIADTAYITVILEINQTLNMRYIYVIVQSQY